MASVLLIEPRGIGDRRGVTGRQVTAKRSTRRVTSGGTTDETEVTVSRLRRRRVSLLFPRFRAGPSPCSVWTYTRDTPRAARPPRSLHDGAVQNVRCLVGWRLRTHLRVQLRPRRERRG